jgi:hypothetical protein
VKGLQSYNSHFVIERPFAFVFVFERPWALTSNIFTFDRSLPWKGPCLQSAIAFGFEGHLTLPLPGLGFKSVLPSKWLCLPRAFAFEGTPLVLCYQRAFAFTIEGLLP